MLNADTPVPSVRPRWPTYGAMFHELLVAAASRAFPAARVVSKDYDVQRFEYPESLAEVDVVLITGSAASSYEDKEWIRRLDDYVRHVYTHFPKVKMFGSCFGHQLICGSLLKEYGVRVEKDDNGWELGVKEILLNAEYRKAMGQNLRLSKKIETRREVPEKMRVQFVHADHVVIPSPDSLPGSWLVVGTTPHCAVQGVYEPGRDFTLQGHFEFNRFVNTELIKVFGAAWKPEVREEALNAIDAEDDADTVAELALQFMLEGETAMESTAHRLVGGLLTPPLAA